MGAEGHGRVPGRGAEGEDGVEEGVEVVEPPWDVLGPAAGRATRRVNDGIVVC